MTLQDIQQKLVRLTSIVDGWSEGRMNAIERDIALEHLRSIYESLSAATPGDIAPATEPAAMPEHDRPSDGLRGAAGAAGGAKRQITKTPTDRA